jgi:hypothetical protein
LGRSAEVNKIYASCHFEVCGQYRTKQGRFGLAPTGWDKCPAQQASLPPKVDYLAHNNSFPPKPKTIFFVKLQSGILVTLIQSSKQNSNLFKSFLLQIFD